MNNALKTIMLLFLLFGVWIIAVGVSYQNIGKPPLFDVPGGSSLAKFTFSIIPKGMRGILLINSYGLMGVLGVVGGAVVFVSVMALGSMRNQIKALTEYGQESPEEYTRTAEDMQEELRIGRMVNMFQGAITKDEATKLVDDVQPVLSEYLPLMTDAAIVDLARHILEDNILRYRRKGKGISPDQYQTLDKNIIELESEPFGFRYMPDLNSLTTDEMKSAVGKVYDRVQQSKMQKDFQGDAKDWVNVTLANAEDILSRDASKGKGLSISQ